MAAKRSNGEGTFNWKTINGKKYRHWRGMVGINAGTGMPIVKDLYAPTDAELRAKVKAYLKEVEAGTFDKQDFTLKTWLDQWLNDCCRDLKPTTIDRYKSMIAAHIVPKLGAKKIKKLSPMDVQKFVNSLTDECSLSPKSVKCIHGALHSALKSAYSMKFIMNNPADNIVLPKVQKAEANFIAGDDLKRFLEAASEDEYYHEILFSVFTGVRIGELLGLQWDCVNFETGTITIKRNLQLLHGEYHVQTTKSDKERTLSPAPFVMDMLQEQRKDQRKQIKELWAMGITWKTDYVFTRGDGSNISGNTLRKHFKRILAAADLPEDTHYHDLRHSYAVFALESGDNLKEIQAALGHYSAAFTANTYAHVSDQARKESAARQEAAIQALIK